VVEDVECRAAGIPADAEVVEFDVSEIRKFNRAQMSRGSPAPYLCRGGELFRTVRHRHGSLFFPPSRKAAYLVGRSLVRQWNRT